MVLTCTIHCEQMKLGHQSGKNKSVKDKMGKKLMSHDKC